MRKRKTKHYLTLTPHEARLALCALLSYRNKVVVRGIDSVDIDELMKKFS